MDDRSYVGMAHKTCPVCGTKHDEVILLDRRLRNSLPREQFAGYELCPEHSEESKEVLFLVGVSGDPDDGPASFTGDVVRVKRAAADRVFNVPTAQWPFALVPPDVVAMLEKMAANAQEAA